MFEGLKLDGVIGASKSKVTSISDSWSTYGSVREELESLGIVLMKVPAGEMPRTGDIDLSALNNNDFSNYYLRVLAWCNFVGSLLADTKAMLLEVDRKKTLILNDAKDKISQSNTGVKKLAATELKEKAETTGEYLVMLKEHQKLEQKEIMLAEAHKSLQSYAQFISRTVEIRKLDVAQHHIQSNMPGRVVVRP